VKVQCKYSVSTGKVQCKYNVSTLCKLNRPGEMWEPSDLGSTELPSVSRASIISKSDFLTLTMLLRLP